MLKKLDESIMLRILDWAYEKALTQPVPGLESAYSLAQEYSKQPASLDEQIDSLIRWQNTKAATCGFLTGLGGVLVIPVTIPANIASVVFVQIRMIAAIAIMNGHDVRDDRVKTMIYACLCGSAGAEMLKNAGIKIGTSLLRNMLHTISRETLLKINRAIGMRLVTKFGEKGVVNISKVVPIFGGIIGATFDGVTTNLIGNVAKKIFANK